MDQGVAVRYKIIRTFKGQIWSDKHVGARFMWGNGKVAVETVSQLRRSVAVEPVIIAFQL